MNRRIPTDGSQDYYEALQAAWPEERPSRKRRRRQFRKAGSRRVVVTSARLEEPDADRMSRALLAAQRELARAQEEKEARAGVRPEEAPDESA
ncbi:hypothetical protein [Nocardioides pyridinolyticus]